jgi:hypothetical protein
VIVSKLQGGLGNQMFQYATAYSYSKTVYLDFSFLASQNATNYHFTKRDFELTLFPNLKYKEFTEFHHNLFFSKSRKYRLLRKLFQIKLNLIKQQENELVHIQKNRHIYFDGYFQSEQ